MAIVPRLYNDTSNAAFFNWEVCPHFDTVALACTDPKDANSNPIGHLFFAFTAQLPVGDARTPTQWRQACVAETKALVQFALNGPGANALPPLARGT